MNVQSVSRWQFLLAIMVCAPVLAQPTFSKEEFDKYQRSQKERMGRQMLLTQLMNLSYDVGLQKEIQLEPIQIQNLKEMMQAYQQKMQKFQVEMQADIQEMQQLNKDGEYELARQLSNSFQAKHGELVDELNDEVQGVLKQEQFDRMNQIAKQQHVRQMNPYRDEFGVVLALADELELTPEQRELLTSTIEKVRTKYYEDLAKLKQEANEQILRRLPESTREQMEKILGPRFDHEANRRRRAAEARERMLEARKRYEQNSNATEEKKAQREEEEKKP